MSGASDMGSLWLTATIPPESMRVHKRKPSHAALVMNGKSNHALLMKKYIDMRAGLEATVGLACTVCLVDIALEASWMRSAACRPMMWTPRISPVSFRYIILARPSPSFSARACTHHHLLGALAGADSSRIVLFTKCCSEGLNWLMMAVMPPGGTVYVVKQFTWGWEHRQSGIHSVTAKGCNHVANSLLGKRIHSLSSCDG